MRNLFTIIVLTLIPFLVIAQKNTSIAVFVGSSQSGTDVSRGVEDDADILKGINFAYGLKAKYNHNPNWATRFHYFGSKIQGKDVDLGIGNEKRGFEFNSSIHEVSLALEYDVFGKRRYNEGTFEKKPTFYVFGGFGFSFTNPVVGWNGLDNIQNEFSSRIATDKSEVKKMNLQIPMGAGLKYDLNEKVFLELEASSRVPFTDYIDGISASANPENNDSYQFLGLFVNYKFGDKVKLSQKF